MISVILKQFSTKALILSHCYTSRIILIYYDVVPKAFNFFIVLIEHISKRWLKRGSSLNMLKGMRMKVHFFTTYLEIVQ